MRILIYGAGAIGGYIGASLISSGESVVMVARGEHYKKIYSDGLTLTTSGESITVRPQLIIDKIQDAPPEVDLLCLRRGKRQHLSFFQKRKAHTA